MKRGFVLLIITIFILSGCSGGKQTEKITKDDMGIEKIDSGKKVTYGMSRVDAEAVLGTGEKSGSRGLFEYGSGVFVAYRDDAVVAIMLSDESKGVFKTTRGAEVGMLKAKLEEIYGHSYLPNESESNLDYVYDSKAGKYLDKNSPRLSDEEATNTYVISAMFNENGYADRIYLLDNKYSIYGE
ncbi:hypothetical protein FHS19_006878 [Paenibacillus rhizosphaerae]|uniref:Uncharacterized protein n=1 Tax=Paenibacillus rhizosphaerae TaxID=297318 RepID=A0A839U0C0_9BACL|nr:hypothetical protein [Paenibacillus rhizosphaerae]MBB3132151.1 hypothetical protein [Paenibacillus rhizosphaerae]